MRPSPLRRTPMRSRPRRRPEVDWDRLREAVLQRDVVFVIRFARLRAREDELTLRFDGKLPWCMAAVLDPDEWGRCQGRWTLNHVEDPALPMRGRKPPDDIDHLVSLCDFHHQGMEAGRNWAARSENKILQWRYLLARKAERAA